MAHLPIRKIVVANRGEIAVRVMRTCRELGIATVAVFSDPDRTAPHVQMADEAYRIGPAPAAESYLLTGRILEIAARTGADAVHPGYGFLSENPVFAEACIAAGVRFIGPPPGAIRTMGDKTAARNLMRSAGVPLVPGTEGAIDDLDEALQAAETVGWPVLIKAAAGGGGKGMRIVREPGGFERALEAARREAEAAFGDGRVFLEKYIEEPRHVEIQVLADSHGNVVHLFERECSIQRRHQKVIEEAPSSVVTPDLRSRMGTAAVEAARACGYVNAGTVEFLVDDDHRFYFMEMNTRLQVEHPVTEWVTGLDLVAEQIRIAAGEPLGYRQDDLELRGHAIEARVYAEDAANGFLPDPGRLVRHRPPSGFGIRVDAGVDEGGEVLIHYDPMIAKLTAWGRTREEAIRRLQRAIDEYEVSGVSTTLPFCRFVLGHEAFRSGRFSTHFVDKHYRPGAIAADGEDDHALAAAAVLIDAHTRGRAVSDRHCPEGTPGFSPWRARRG